MIGWSSYLMSRVMFTKSLNVHYYERYCDLSSRMEFAIMRIQLPLNGSAMKPMYTERRASRLIGDHVIGVSCQLHSVNSFRLALHLTLLRG